MPKTCVRVSGGMHACVCVGVNACVWVCGCACTCVFSVSCLNLFDVRFSPGTGLLVCCSSLCCWNSGRGITIRACFRAEVFRILARAGREKDGVKKKQQTNYFNRKSVAEFGVLMAEKDEVKKVVSEAVQFGVPRKGTGFPPSII